MFSSRHGHYTTLSLLLPSHVVDMDAGQGLKRFSFKPAVDRDKMPETPFSVSQESFEASQVGWSSAPEGRTSARGFLASKPGVRNYSCARTVKARIMNRSKMGRGKVVSLETRSRGITNDFRNTRYEPLDFAVHREMQGFSYPRFSSAAASCTS